MTTGVKAQAGPYDDVAAIHGFISRIMRSLALPVACIAVMLVASRIAAAATIHATHAPAGATRGDEPLRPIYRVEPAYPRMAQFKNYEGVVTVCFTVTAQGAVTGVKRVGYSKLSAPAGPYAPASATVRKAQARKLLGGAAVATVRNWRFSPARLHGKAVATHGVCQDIGFKVLKGMLAKNLKGIQKAAAAGSATAEFQLGVHYVNGIGVKKDTAKARRWIRKSARQGNAYAEAALGMLYMRKGSPAATTSKGVKWLRKSADQGNATAEWVLGLLYERGEGVSMDVTRAAHWYLKAAKQGDSDAAGRLGYLYAYGLGVRKDCRQAFYWLENAAREGSLKAQTALKTFGTKGHLCYVPPV